MEKNQNKEQDIMDYLAKDPFKTTKKLQEIVNCMCYRCRTLARLNPKRSFDEYCQSCKDKMKKIWEE